MTWTLTISGVRTITIDNPTGASYSNKAWYDTIDIPTDFPFILGMGKEAPTLTIEGKFIATTETLMNSTYLYPLMSSVFSVVHIAAHNSRYDGDYILAQFDFNEQGGVVGCIGYTMMFARGSEILTLA